MYAKKDLSESIIGGGSFLHIGGCPIQFLGCPIEFVKKPERSVFR